MSDAALLPPVLECTVEQWLDRLYETVAEPLPAGQSVLLTDFDPKRHTQKSREGWRRVVGGRTWHVCSAEPTEEDWLKILGSEWPGIVWGIK